MAKKILLVEDNETLGYVLKEYLQMKDFQVVLADDGKKGLEAFAPSNFDICILDVMMPEIDGFSLAKMIREKDQHVPIIFLTAKSLKVDKLKAFNIGADDYIIKPVDEEELVARIKAVLRRTTQQLQQVEIFTIGEYTFDTKNQKLIFNDVEQFLTERETKILKLLCQHKDNLLSRKYVLQSIWGKSDYFNRRSMDVFISKLRKYLSKDSNIKITNVHGSGFILSDKAQK